jgi:zinc transporter ZupT
MGTLFAICGLTTVVALASVFWAADASLHRRVLPWTAGLLLGIAVFWILPEMAESRGWTATLAGVSGILLLLGLIDRYVYPICPFCAAGIHSHEHSDPAAGACHHALTIGWPLLAAGCLHVFFDGWTIALSQSDPLSHSAAALSWGVTIHKIPESVAIGLLAGRLARNRGMAVGAVLLLQAVMASGGALALFAGQVDRRWADLSAIPACAFLLLFGLLTLQQEWQSNGRALAVRALMPGLLGCGLAALVSTMLVH